MGDVRRWRQGERDGAGCAATQLCHNGLGIRKHGGQDVRVFPAGCNGMVTVMRQVRQEAVPGQGRHHRSRAEGAAQGNSWERAAFGPPFFGPDKTPPPNGVRHSAALMGLPGASCFFQRLRSALQLLELARLAIPLLGVRQRVLLFADVRPHLG